MVIDLRFENGPLDEEVLTATDEVVLCWTLRNRLPEYCLNSPAELASLDT